MKYQFEITKYHFEKIDGKPKIIIEMVKVMDEKGKYIKFAKLEKVIEFLGGEKVLFKNLDE
jgi:hypothetical protein